MRSIHPTRLHYAKPMFHGEKLEDSALYKGLSAIGAWRQANRGARPQMVWYDTPAQVRAGSCVICMPHVCLNPPLSPAGASMLGCSSLVFGGTPCTPAPTLTQRYLATLLFPSQHFTSEDGAYYSGHGPFNCSPILSLPAVASNASVQARVEAGGWYNIGVKPLLPRIADAHLRVW